MKGQNHILNGALGSLRVGWAPGRVGCVESALGSDRSEQWGVVERTGVGWEAFKCEEAWLICFKMMDKGRALEE